jgi:Tfp pilus assembly protein PilF
MKRNLLLILLLSIVGASQVRGQDDQYVLVYNLIQQADTLSQGGQNREAADKYREAQTVLKRMQSSYPLWNADVVKFRLNYVQEKLQTAPSAATATGIAATPRPGTSTPAPIRREEPAPARNDIEMQSLREEVRHLNIEKNAIDAKLKEALSLRPSPVDPRDLERAQQNLAAVEKERDLLKASLDQEKQKGAEKARKEEDAKANRAEAKRLKDLERERDDLASKLAAANRQAASVGAQSKKFEQDRAEWQRKLDAATAESAELKARRDEKLAAVQADARKLKQLESERDELRGTVASTQKKLAALQSESKSKSADSKRADSLERDRLELTAKLESANKELQALRGMPREAAKPEPIPQTAPIDRGALQTELDRAYKQLADSEAKQDEAHLGKIHALEKERDALLKQLQERSKPAPAAKPSKTSARLDDAAANELVLLRAKVSVLEAQKVPFTREELAAMKQSPTPVQLASLNSTPSAAPAEAPASTANKPVKHTAKDLPPGAGALAAEAERAFGARRYDEAEKKYLQILQQDENNIYVLGNLAATEWELKHYGDAEKHVKRALALDADDGPSLTLFGILRINQRDYDGAVQSLSRATQIDPKNADAQNYLGIALSEKGQRGPAEAALRKAIQLQPDNAMAHHNLAIVYATQTPPFLELARFHYQKAKALGHGRSDLLDKLLPETK